MRRVTEQEPRSHSHLAALRAQEHIVISGSMLPTHGNGSSKIAEPSIISPAEVERKLKEFEEIKPKISGGMKMCSSRCGSSVASETRLRCSSPTKLPVPATSQ